MSKRGASQKWPVDWVLTGELARPLGIRAREARGGTPTQFKIQISGINTRPRNVQPPAEPSPLVRKAISKIPPVQNKWKTTISQTLPVPQWAVAVGSGKWGTW